MALSIMIIFFVNCNLKNTPVNSSDKEGMQNGPLEEISINVKTVDKDDLEIFEDGFIPWISIKNPDEHISNLSGKDEIVLSSKKAILLVEYPLNNPFAFEIKSENSKGFTRGELVLAISKLYNRIYQEEEESANIKTVPLEERKGLINRNETDGKYGIWGHDIDDLDLSGIVIHKGENGVPKLELLIES